MTAIAEKVYKEALTLEPVDRAELIEVLIHSFDHTLDQHIDDAWRVEVDDRVAAIERGDVTMYSEEEVFARINKL